MKHFLGMFLVMGALALSLAGCPKPMPNPIPPGPDADAAADDDSGRARATCSSACAHGMKLGCDWARPTQGGAPCTTVCANANRVDGPLRWNLSCRTSTTSCTFCP